MRQSQKMKNIFSDKATIIPRKMLQDPQREWVVRDFIGPEGVSLGMAQSVLEAMAKKGYVERVKRGPDSHTVLTNKDMLITDWLKEYEFELNTVDSYYSADKKVLEKAKGFLREKQHALTLHTGANLTTSFVKTDEIYLYLQLADWNNEMLDLRQKLDLKELVRGGNFHIVRPYYKNSVFFNRQKIKGFAVVSNLQLYLDLYHFQPRGREHAEYLKNLLEEKGKSLD
jgi:hypothetical protein